MSEHRPLADHRISADDPERDEGALPGLLDDPEVVHCLASLDEEATTVRDELDQLCADLDDNRLAIAQSQLWLMGEAAREVRATHDRLKVRLDALAATGDYASPLDVI